MANAADVPLQAPPHFGCGSSADPAHPRPSPPPRAAPRVPPQLKPSSFIAQLWAILAEPSHAHVVAWHAAGTEFEVKLPKRMREVLPLYFKHNNFSSFQRQLNYFGFRKCGQGPDGVGCSYAHDCFRRDRPELLTQIARKTNRAYRAKLKAEADAKALAQAGVPTGTAAARGGAVAGGTVERSSTPGGGAHGGIATGTAVSATKEPVAWLLASSAGGVVSPATPCATSSSVPASPSNPSPLSDMRGMEPAPKRACEPAPATGVPRSIGQHDRSGTVADGAKRGGGKAAASSAGATAAGGGTGGSGGVYGSNDGWQSSALAYLNGPCFAVAATVVRHAPPAPAPTRRARAKAAALPNRAAARVRAPAPAPAPAHACASAPAAAVEPVPLSLLPPVPPAPPPPPSLDLTASGVHDVPVLSPTSSGDARSKRQRMMAEPPLQEQAAAGAAASPFSSLELAELEQMEMADAESAAAAAKAAEVAAAAAAPALGPSPTSPTELLPPPSLALPRPPVQAAMAAALVAPAPTVDSATDVGATTGVGRVRAAALHRPDMQLLARVTARHESKGRGWGGARGGARNQGRSGGEDEGHGAARPAHAARPPAAAGQRGQGNGGLDPCAYDKDPLLKPLSPITPSESKRRLAPAPP